jgi:hypothetical protein
MQSIDGIAPPFNPQIGGFPPAPNPYMPNPYMIP